MTRFSKDYQPKNKNGRKPSRIKEIAREIEYEGEPLSKEDIRRVIRILFEYTPVELREKLKDPNLPSVVVAIIKAILKDISKGDSANTWRMLRETFMLDKGTNTVVISDDSANEHRVVFETYRKK